MQPTPTVSLLMCFSATADLVIGLGTGLIGIDALRHVRAPREQPLASLPLLLGVHQLVEALVWLGLTDRVPLEVAAAARWFYLIVAFVVLPTLVPCAVRRIEPDLRRRSTMALPLALGVVVSLVLAYYMTRGPVTARLADHHIEYGIGLDYAVPIVTAYVVATCGALLASSIRPVARFGALNALVVVVLAGLQHRGLASLWCAWAAVTSVVIAALLRSDDPGRERPTELHRVG